MNNKCPICGLSFPGSLETFKAMVSIREDHGQIKPECYSLNGTVFEFISGFAFDDDDKRYPFEHAMIFTKRNVPISWIACGDLKFQ